jgi:uncharacterized protein YdbL (DUF1318 family)
MKPAIRSLLVVAVTALVVACVTINVYFPEAAAERAADRFIRDVIGEQSDTDGEDSAAILPRTSAALAWVGRLLIADAHAQSPDIDLENPQIEAIKQRMAERHRRHLADWFDAGAIGLDNDGLVAIRDRGAVPLSERRELERVVAEENADRRAVYREIAVANDQPEWEDEIRQTFARRWIANARSGWYYQNDAGEWVRK